MEVHRYEVLRVRVFLDLAISSNSLLGSRVKLSETSIWTSAWDMLPYHTVRYMGYLFRVLRKIFIRPLFCFCSTVNIEVEKRLIRQRWCFVKKNVRFKDIF